MRLSTSMMYANGLKGVLSQETDMNRLVEQIGSGRKFLTPADDPLAAALSINVAQTQSMNATYQLNRNTAKTNLGQENNVLDSVTTALESVRTRVVQAGNGTMSDSDRQALSTALKSAREALLGLANSTDGNGQYMFSGYQGSAAPYVQNAAGQVVYSGATGERTIQVDQSRQMSTSDLGKDIFSRANPGAQGYVSSASPGNTGTAQFGTASITPGGANVGKNFSVAFEADPTTGAIGYRVTTTDPSGATPPVINPAPPASPPLIRMARRSISAACPSSSGQAAERRHHQCREHPVGQRRCVQHIGQPDQDAGFTDRRRREGLGQAGQ